MTKKEIVEKLVELGIEHDPTLLKAELETLLPVVPPAEDPTPDPTPAPAVVKPDPIKSIANQYVFVKTSGTAKANSTAERFAGEPKERIVVFPKPDEGNAQTHFCGINGVYFAIVMGVEVELPRSVARFVQEGRMKDARAERNIRVTNTFTGEIVNVDLQSAPDETKRRLGIL